MTTKTEDEKHSPLYETSRKVLLAAVGAAVLAQDEMLNFIDRLAEHGEIAERDARKLMKEMLEKREKMLKERQAEREKTRPATASKSDVDALNARVVELQKQVEELKKAGK
jgi:polyhydroxyalkanoate synthesis regulator phasin